MSSELVECEKLSGHSRISPIVYFYINSFLKITLDLEEVSTRFLLLIQVETIIQFLMFPFL